MTDTNQKKLGSTLWGIADQLRGAMDADDFRDYMLSFLFLRYLSDNYETAARKELGKDYPALPTAQPLAKRAIVEVILDECHRSRFLAQMKQHEYPHPLAA